MGPRWYTDAMTETTDRGDSRKAMNLRLPADLMARLQAYARRTERSANAAATFAIRQFLDEHADDAGSN